MMHIPHNPITPSIMMTNTITICVIENNVQVKFKKLNLQKMIEPPNQPVVSEFPEPPYIRNNNGYKP